MGEIFQGFEKIGRLSKGMVITEKIDGTNAQIFIRPEHDEEDPNIIASKDGFLLYAGSRNRWITPGNDNFGFATWAHDNSDSLFALGEGRHFGEWWGQGIQRRYGLTEKRFSLFNVGRWSDSEGHRPPVCCHIVPVLYRGPFDTSSILETMAKLKEHGSYATDFNNPEGIVIYHEASRTLYKKTFEFDEGKFKEEK